MESTITGLGLAIFGLLTVVYLTTELTGMIAGREVLPRVLRPLATVDRGPRSAIGAFAGRVVIVALGQSVIVGVLVSGIASRDPVSVAALIIELVLATLWVASLVILCRARGHLSRRP